VEKVKFVILLLICISSVYAFGQDNFSAEQPLARQTITPLTLEIVNIIQNSGKNFNELNYYVSKPFTLVISEQYDVPKVEIQDGTLIMPEKEKVRTILFNGQQGRLHGFPVSGSTDIFEVNFQVEGKNIALRFKKNRQRHFELFSALIDARPYNLSSETKFLLAISSNIDADVEKDEVQAYPYMGVAGRFLEGKGSLEKDQIKAYIKKQNPSLEDNYIETLINTYIQEADFENVNLDIAIAQMLYATSFLKGNKFVSSNNYGGLSLLPGWDGKFSSMTEGVRAHIQHIKGYASTTMNNPQIVDPRYNLLTNLKYIGTAKTFEQLCEKWATSPASYKKSIETILEGLYK